MGVVIYSHYSLACVSVWVWTSLHYIAIKFTKNRNGMFHPHNRLINCYSMNYCTVILFASTVTEVMMTALLSSSPPELYDLSTVSLKSI